LIFRNLEALTLALTFNGPEHTSGKAVSECGGSSLSKEKGALTGKLVELLG